jgi:chromosome segregation ATPase
MNTIDTRDLQKRMDELEELRDAIGTAKEAVDEGSEIVAELAGDADATDDQKERAKEALEDAETAFGKDEREELAEIEEIASEVSDFRDGETLIPVSDFTEHVRELLHDIGEIPKTSRIISKSTGKRQRTTCALTTRKSGTRAKTTLCGPADPTSQNKHRTE